MSGKEFCFALFKVSLAGQTFSSCLHGEIRSVFLFFVKKALYVCGQQLFNNNSSKSFLEVTKQ